MAENREKMTMGRLMRVNRMHRSVVEKRFKELGVHRSQHMMLIYLANSPTAPSQKQIAEHFNVTPAAIAMSMKKMEKNGLIERQAAPFDNRVNIIKVSEKGANVLEETRAMFNSMDEAAFNGVSDQEMEQLFATLDKIVENLRSVGGDDCNFCSGKRKKI